MKTCPDIIRLLICGVVIYAIIYAWAHVPTDEEAEWAQSIHQEMAYDYDYE